MLYLVGNQHILIADALGGGGKTSHCTTRLKITSSNTTAVGHLGDLIEAVLGTETPPQTPSLFVFNLDPLADLL